MRIQSRRLWSILLLSVLATSSLLAQELPEGEGREIVAKACSGCHGLGNVTKSRFTAEEWRNVALDMDAPLSEAEVDIVAAYLGKFFGPESRSAGSAETQAARTNVNTASAKEIESQLDFSAEEAAAIVEYRSQHGNFKQWEDLTKVPGLRAEKVEAVKERVSF